jgi:hypothetical protein
MEALQDTSVRTTASRDISKHLRKELEGYWHKILDEMDLDLGGLVETWQSVLRDAVVISSCPAILE